MSRKLTSIEPRRYRLRHGRRPLDVWVAGAGPPIVLLHGWGLSGRAYRAAMRAIAARDRRVIAPSLAVADGAWTLPGMAERAAEAMAAMDAHRAPVAGHSFGGAVAVRLAVDRPEFVAALLLVDSLGVSPGVTSLARVLLPGRHWRVAANAPTAATLLGTAVARGGIRSLARAARWVVGQGLEPELQTLRDWAMPAVVLWAERETLLPQSIGRRTALLLGCEFRLVSASDGWPDRVAPDHDWPFRAPGFFAQRVLAELAELLPA
jgi:pimeloyl-ACP methyl ester carboxylesterase